jgi:hypothetical protein
VEEEDGQEDEQEDEQSGSNSEPFHIASFQFDIMEVDQGEEEEIVISYTRSERIRR